MNAEVIITIFGIIVAYYSFTRALDHKNKKGFKYDGYASMEINAALGIIIGFEKYTDFDGKASRLEFWNFMLGSVLLSILAWGIDINFLGGGQIAGWILSAVLVTPQIAIATRRLHDTGRSGWLQLVGLTIIGMIPLIIWWASEGGKTYKRSSKEISKSKNELSQELKELKQLYKDGDLSKEEYSKAKDKILK
tara:strand:- start:167 stop:745 length:579 start_codon:yes stop_codon:yes gene_type:complete